MREDRPRLTVSKDGDVMTVGFSDRKILDEMSIMQIGDQLNALVAEAEKPKIVLDFSSVAHMSSSALGVLITAHKRIREKGGQLRLCNIESAIYEVFVITRLNEIFTICDSREEAMKSLA